MASVPFSSSIPYPSPVSPSPFLSKNLPESQEACPLAPVLTRHHSSGRDNSVSLLAVEEETEAQAAAIPPGSISQTAEEAAAGLVFRSPSQRTMSRRVRKPHKQFW